MKLDLKILLTLNAIWIPAVLLLAACTPEEIAERERRTIESNNQSTKLVATVDGCTVYRVYDSEKANYPYFAKCDGKAVGTFETHTSGKTKKDTFTLGE